MKRALSRKNLWDKVPAPGKAAIGSVLSQVPLPYLLGREFRRWYRLVGDADRWSAERAREYQLTELRRIVTLAYEKTAFYREAFAAVGFEPGDLKQLEDLQRLPTIDKTTVREHWERMLTCSVTDSRVDMVTTGGTSGEPLRFYMGSARHAPEFAHLTSCWKRVGYRPGDVFAVLRGRVIKQPTDGMYYEHDPLLRTHAYSTFHMSPGDLRRYLEHMNQVRPDFIHAYPTALMALARFALSEGMPFPSSIRAALVESEPVFDHQRDLLQRGFGLRIFSAYGLSEKVALAAECESSDLYHVVPTYGVCEITDQHGSMVDVGAHGELTGTAFLNDVMPFIRYRTGDDATLAGVRCEACGREQMLVTRIEPRRGQEFLVWRDGRTLMSMATLTGGLLHDDTLDGILRFQFFQDRPGAVVLQLVPAKESPKYSAEYIHRHFAKQLGHGIDLELKFVDAIPLTRAGKQPMIVQQCPGIEDLIRAHAAD
jgi:phenylacetate-CoA ligase